MNFTQDWFSHNIPSLQAYLKDVEVNSILEIGCFEGRSSCWFLQNVLADDGVLVSVDTFAGSMEHDGMDFSEVRNRWSNNTDKAKKPSQIVNLWDDPSLLAMSDLLFTKNEFDLIYIDGSHEAADVMTDACMGYHLLKVGGSMIFDDYLWNMNWAYYQRPKPAIDAFVELFYGRVAVTSCGYQLIVKRLK